MWGAAPPYACVMKSPARSGRENGAHIVAGGISMKVLAPLSHIATTKKIKILASEQEDVLFTLTMALSGERQVSLLQ